MAVDEDLMSSDFDKAGVPGPLRLLITHPPPPNVDALLFPLHPLLMISLMPEDVLYFSFFFFFFCKTLIDVVDSILMVNELELAYLMHVIIGVGMNWGVLKVVPMVSSWGGPLSK